MILSPQIEKVCFALSGHCPERAWFLGDPVNVPKGCAVFYLPVGQNALASWVRMVCAGDYEVAWTELIAAVCDGYSNKREKI